MKRTSTSPKAKDKLLRLGAVVFWLLLWQIGSMLLNQEILLVSPVSVLIRLLELITGGGQPAAAAQFWSAAAFSFGAIRASSVCTTGFPPRELLRFSAKDRI